MSLFVLPTIKYVEIFMISESLKHLKKINR